MGMMMMMSFSLSGKLDEIQDFGQIQQWDNALLFEHLHKTGVL